MGRTKPLQANRNPGDTRLQGSAASATSRPAGALTAEAQTPPSRSNRLKDGLAFAQFSAATAREIARERIFGHATLPAPAKAHSLAGKTALVTGGNAGIGRSAAEQLARAGATVILLCRNRERGLKAKSEIEAAVSGAKVQVVVGDLSRPDSVAGALQQVHRQFPRIDVLVNNGGGPQLEANEVDGVEGTFAANYLGHFQLTLGLLDRLAPDARVINISSGLHRRASGDVDTFAHPERFNALHAYADAKLAQIMFGHELSKRLEGSKISVVAMDPGPVKSNVLAHDGDPFAGVVKTAMRALGPLYRSTDDAAQGIVSLATRADLAEHSGEYFELGTPSKSSARSYDEPTSARLWEQSLELLGLKDPLASQKASVAAAATFGEHLTQLRAAVATPAPEDVIARSELKPLPGQEKLDGLRPKLFVSDADGNRYVFKVSQLHDPLGGYREQRFATELLKLKGEATIPTVPKTLVVEGKTLEGSVSPLIDNLGTLSGSPKDWNAMQMTQVLRTSVWGRWLRNRDMHPGQFLRVKTADGGEGAINIDWDMTGHWHAGHRAQRAEDKGKNGISRHELMHPVAPPTSESSVFRRYVRDPNFHVDFSPMIAAARDIESLTEAEVRQALHTSGMNDLFSAEKPFGRFKTEDEFIASLMKDKEGLADRYTAFIARLDRERARKNWGVRGLLSGVKDVHLAALAKFYSSAFGEGAVRFAQTNVGRIENRLHHGGATGKP
jgi:NAD(P)-dependent dehydrogenase (short-subunit alcohol dehydrogenase family)